VLRADRRDRSGPDPTLHLRILLFCLGAGSAVAGIYYDASWLITVAIVILAVGVVLSLMGARRRRDAQEAEWRARADAFDEDDAFGGVAFEDDLRDVGAGEDSPEQAAPDDEARDGDTRDVR
jgi:hypothetical protein